jgi:hypothetical protein
VTRYNIACHTDVSSEALHVVERLTLVDNVITPDDRFVLFRPISCGRSSAS